MLLIQDILWNGLILQGALRLNFWLLFAPRAAEQIVQSAACMEAQQQKTALITDSQKDS